MKSVFIGAMYGKIKFARNIHGGVLKYLLHKWRKDGIIRSLRRVYARYSRHVDVAESDVQEYLSRLFADGPQLKGPFFEAAEPLEHGFDASRIRVFAFFLPQFHRSSENDAFWEKNFTEWTNVTKAVPQFVGHHQPQLPYEIGFYDLSDVKALRSQAEMARNFGVSGFCFHYYWFSGKKILYKPLENLLKNSDIEIEFCICWANENWTRRWDGEERDVLLAQEDRPQDHEELFRDWLLLFKDRRYLRDPIGRPIIIVYRPDVVNNCGSAIATWRRLAKQSGLPGIVLLMTNAFENRDYRRYGFDGIVEFPPHGLELVPSNRKEKIVNKHYSGSIYDMNDFFKSKHFREMRGESNVFKCVFPSWDNEARKPGRGVIYTGVTPERFQVWLQKAADNTGGFDWANRQKLVFVNAWNEWAEGAHLEPDRRYGYAYLNRLARVVAKSASDKSTFEE